MFYIKLDIIKYKILNFSDDYFFKDVILSYIVVVRDIIVFVFIWFFWFFLENFDVVVKIC